jgi:hypothetical protein
MWVFRRFGFSDSLMAKVAFNNPYRLSPQIFRGAETVLKRRGRVTDRLGLVTQKNVTERRRETENVTRR